MRTLYLLRHAKSSWGDASLSDIERPLNARGERDAPRMGAALGDRYPPMTFYVSPAERAQGTFAGIKSQWAGLQVRMESQRLRSIPLTTATCLSGSNNKATRDLHWHLSATIPH